MKWSWILLAEVLVNVGELTAGRERFPADASFQEMAQACWDQFEPFVRANPAPWLWMYKHWRYRPLAADPCR